MRSQPRSGKRRHVLRWVAVAAVVVVAGGTLGAYLKYRAVYDSITRVTVPSTALGHRPPVYSTTSENILVYGDDTRSGLTPHQQLVLHAGHDQTNNTDTVSGLNMKSGEQHITGIQALAFWRTREDLGDGSDLQRIQRDQFMSAQVVKGVLHSGLLSNPIRLLRIVSDAAASMTTDAGMTVSDLVEIGQSFRNLSGQNVQFITMPNEKWAQDANRVQPMQPQAGQVFSAIARDVTVPKVSTTPASSSSGGAQVLTTSPGKVKVEV